MNDPHNLQRFLDAQEAVFDTACAELQRGHKTTHWIWFIFPQIAGLGHSTTSRKFAIANLDEAKAYVKHPILGERLRRCTAIVNALQGRSASQVFGYPDDMKFQSSMTLFARAAPDDEVFEQALQKYFAAEPDRQTLDRL
jgi:uncharacterized protein (DUF1810 family)